MPIDLEKMRATRTYRDADPVTRKGFEEAAAAENARITPVPSGTPGPTPGQLPPRGSPFSGLGSALIGDTPEERWAGTTALGMDALRMGGMVASPGARFAAMALPPLVGAARGAMAHPENRTGGAISGLYQGAKTVLPAELLSLGVEKGIERSASRGGLAKILQERFPTQSARLGKKIARLESFLRGPAGENAIGDELKAVVKDVDQVMGPRDVTSVALDVARHHNLLTPSFDAVSPGGTNPGFSFVEADKAISILGNRGYTKELPAQTMTAPQIRQLHHEATQELISEIAKVDPKRAQAYAEANARFSDMKMLRNMVFTQKGVIENGAIRRGEVQKLIVANSHLRDRLEKTPFGQQFMEWAFRGADPVATDVAGSFSPRAFMHMGGKPGLSGHLFDIPRTVGEKSSIPFMRSGGIESQRILEWLMSPRAAAEGSLP